MNSVWNNLLVFTYTPSRFHSGLEQLFYTLLVTVGNLALIVGYIWIVVTALRYVGVL